MKASHLIRSVVALLLGALLVWAGDPWKEKPWTEWTEKEVYKVLEDSPWAQVYVRTRESRLPSDPSMAGGTPDMQRTPQITDAHLRVVWESARTVREAEARLSQLQNVGKEKGEEWRLKLPEDYVIWVGGYVYEGSYLAELEDFERLSDEAKRQSAYLELKQLKKKVLPIKAEMQFTQTAMGAARMGRVMDARFYFPREVDGEPLLGPAEKKVAFRWLLKRMPVGADFDLSKMVRDGQPDL